jgi:flagellar biosynthesis anti-sigma factor FlgM
MKIENTNLSSLSSKPLESARRVEKKETPKGAHPVQSRSDKVEMSGDARLLAKAHAALAGVDKTEAENLEALKAKIESGDYTIQVNELARKLAAKLYSQS